MSAARPLRIDTMEDDALGPLAAALEDRFGPGIVAVLVVRRPQGPRWSQPRSLPQPDSVVRPIAHRVLDLARIPHRLVGRGYMEDAVCLLAAGAPGRPTLAGGVYAAVAGRRGTTAAGVERGIRHAVEGALRADRAAAEAVLGCGVRCTNAAVLYRLLALVEQDLSQGGAGEGWG